MTVDSIAQIITAIPEMRVVSADKDYWISVIGEVVEQVIAEIGTAYDFDFTLKDYGSVTSVADTAAYKLQGRNSDLRDIVAIRYGTELLDRIRRIDAYEIQESGASLGGTVAWYQSDLIGGFPEVTLIDAPGTSGVALNVLYRRRNIELGTIPDEFGFVIAQGVLSWLRPDRRILFERALKKMIKNHKRGGKDIDLVGVDPHIAMTNNKIADLYGAG
jgi:hypothetical protein